jgi:succinate dehydrogenase / fumarate reductase flavoprotein subunit
MGGLWVDYELMTSVEGLYAIGEANFSDHGANRLGASALMQGLADGYFVLPYTIGNYLADEIGTGSISTNTNEFVEAEAAAKARSESLFNVKGTQSVESFHRRLGKIIWDYCGMARNATDLAAARIMVQKLREEFYKDVKILGTLEGMNTDLDKALRVADFIELGELMIIDALNRNESCGGHFREESATDDGEAKRNDEDFAYVAAWQHTKVTADPILHKEDLHFEAVKLTQRSYK